MCRTRYRRRASASWRAIRVSQVAKLARLANWRRCGRRAPRRPARRLPPHTEPGWNTHTAAEIGTDDFQSDRDPDRRYRTTPLAGLWAHAKGGYYHDGRFATLPDVIRHYDRTFGLGLTDSQVVDLSEFLRSLPND
jgi:cytochrome c peroxidase